MPRLLDWLRRNGPNELKAAAAIEPPELQNCPSTLRFDYTAVEMLEAEAPVDGRPAGRPKFAIDAYNGGVITANGFYYPVIADLAGMKAAGETIPVLRDHDIGRLVGQGEPTIAARSVKVKGIVTGDSGDAVDVMTHAKNGFKWKASIGASIVRREFIEAGKTAKVNGQTISGPAIIARESTLNEVSFVALGADRTTAATVAASHSTNGSQDMNFDQWLKACGYKPAMELSPQVRAGLKAAFDAGIEPGFDLAPPEVLGGWLKACGVGTAMNDLSVTEKISAVQMLVESLRASRLDAQPAAAGSSVAGGLNLGGGNQLPAGNTSNGTADPVAMMRIEAKRQADIERICGSNAANAELKAQAISEGWTSDQTELRVLRAMRGHAPAIHIANSNVGPDVLRAAICMTGGLKDCEKQFNDQTLQAAHTRFRRGVSLQEVLLEAAWAQGFTGRSFRNEPEAVLRAAFSSVDLPGILANTANKFLLEGYGFVENKWRRIAKRRNVSDFKTITSYRMTGAFTFEEVGPSGELKGGEISEESFANKAKTYGKMFSITRTDMINDDLGALTDVPRMIGRGAALKFNAVFWAIFLNNSTFFTTGRNNYFTGASTNLQSSSLATAVKMFRDQVDSQGDPISVDPALLLVSTSDEVTADELYVSTNLNTGGAASTTKVPNRNVFAGKYEPVVSSYLGNANYTGYSTTAWYLLADPEAGGATIEACFLNGQENPTVESADAQFNVLGIDMRGYFDFGVALQDWLFGVKSKGAA